MTFQVSSLGEDDARTILSWRYDRPYDFYNVTGDEFEDNLADMLDGSQFAVKDDSGELIGFYAFGQTATVPGGHAAGAYAATDLLDIGLGLRPDLTGRGLGLPFIRAALEFAERTVGARGFRLSVATFNRRAIRVYERAGFVPGTTFTSATPNGDTEFLLMTRAAE